MPRRQVCRTSENKSCGDLKPPEIMAFVVNIIMQKRLKGIRKIYNSE